MRHRKITLGMTDIEVAQDHLSEAELSAVIARLHSSSSRPDDMRNTKTYNPSNSLTASWAMVSLAPLLFISILKSKPLNCGFFESKIFKSSFLTIYKLGSFEGISLILAYTQMFA